MYRGYSLILLMTLCSMVSSCNNSQQTPREACERECDRAASRTGGRYNVVDKNLKHNCVSKCPVDTPILVSE
ncbi:unnamed protein product [Dicrocoelium dendriticum]|nr:unnamed protein product [Dicrocoelium dendriticum]